MTEAFGTLCANGLVLDNFSAADSSDDEQREDEIKKLLEEGLCNETFDCDSEDSDTASSAYNVSKDDLFPSRQENSEPTKLEENGLNNQRANSYEFKATPSMDAFSISRKPNTNETNEASHSSAGNRSDPILVKYNQRRLENADFNHRDNDVEAMGDHFRSNSPKLSNGNGRHIPQTNEHDWENEEIEGKNPTISLMHTDHCPQNDDNVPSDMWLSAENNTEQLKSLCQFRERKIIRSEEVIASLTKDKRVLNHQIGLMKSEMIQLKSQHDDLEKLMYLKDEEIAYLKTKIREAIDEFEQVRRREISSKDECSRLISENDKLQQEVKLLSAIGSSTQQAEINQLVRQMREKHARDNAAWQKAVSELEGQIRVYKRTQQLFHEESFTVAKRTAETQTENSVPIEESEDEAREKALAEKEFREEFGGVYENGTETGASAKVEEELRMQMLEMQNKWDKEKKEIVEGYEIEIDAYRSRLSTLPAKLYETWQKTQEALRLSSPSKKKPESRSITTSTDNIVEREVAPATNAHNEVERISEKNSVNGAGDLNSLTNGRNEIQSGHKKSDNMEASSALIQPSPKETSSVIIQTEETLETYRVLAGLIEQWTTEVAQSSDRAKRAESLVSVAEEELNKLRKKFKYLQKMATSCRKEWKKQEDYLRKKNSDLKSHYMNILLKVNEKLEGIEIE